MAIKKIIYNPGKATEQLKKAADTIYDIFCSVEKSDVDAVCKIIQNPNRLVSLLGGKNVKIILPCFYAMQALLFRLRKHSVSKILRSMSDNDIKTLRGLISVSMTRNCPNKEILQKQMEARCAEKILTEEQGVTSRAMMTSLKIYVFAEKNWDNANIEMQKWADTIDVFERRVIVEEQNNDNTNQEYQGETICFEELAKRLGFKSKNALFCRKDALLRKNKKLMLIVESWFVVVNGRKELKAEYYEDFESIIIPSEGNDKFWSMSKLAKKLELKSMKYFYTLKEKIKRKYPETCAWFVSNFVEKGGNDKFFKAEYFDKFKQIVLLELGSIAIKKDENAERAVQKNVAKTKEKKVSDKSVLMPRSSFDDLVGVKAFELYLQELHNRLEGIQEKMQYAEQEYKETIDDLSIVKNPSERAELLVKLTGINEVLMHAEEMSETYARGSKLMAEKTAAEKALDDVNAKIAKFMKNSTEYKM